MGAKEKQDRDFQVSLVKLKNIKFIFYFVRKNLVFFSLYVKITNTDCYFCVNL